MPGDILIVDCIATNRIVLKVKLLAAQHSVRPCESVAMAHSEVIAARPDLILLDISTDTSAALAFCALIKNEEDCTAIPIIATGAFLAPDDRVQALEAGADDVLSRPFNDQILQARIRSLLRARDAKRELRLRDDTRQALGFCETAKGFSRPAKITLLSSSKRFLADQQKTFSALNHVTILPLIHKGPCKLPGRLDSDLILIDGRCSNNQDTDLFRLLSELRSRSDTRSAALLVALPDTMHATAAMALDLGANDIVSCAATPDEFLLRGKSLIANKQATDNLRQTVQSGLKAAVTDPLTGLYNRRYALPHLRKMAEHSEHTNRDLAVMVLDIDHFKVINDTYGHAAGDDVLRQVADRLRDNMRSSDLLARIGGEEFLIAIPESDLTHARVAAERICHLISDTPFFVGPTRKEIKVTMSIGVTLAGSANSDKAEDPSLLVEAADAALYSAKGSGRNTVSLFAA